MTLTQSQRDALIRNLEVEMDNRIRRLRAQHHLAAKALRAKIEMRINRVPKRLWNKTLAEIAQQEQNKVNGHEAFDLSAGSTLGLYENPIAGRVLAKPVDSAKLLVPKVRKVSKTSKSPVKGMIKQTFRSLSNRARSPLKASNSTTTNATNNTTNYLSPTKSTAASQKPTSTSANRTNSTVKQNIEKFTLLSEDSSTASNGRRLRKGPTAPTASSDRKEEPPKRTTRTRRKPPTASTASTTGTTAATTTTATNPSRATAPTAASARRNLRNRGE